VSLYIAILAVDADQLPDVMRVGQSPDLASPATSTIVGHGEQNRNKCLSRSIGQLLALGCRTRPHESSEARRWSAA
jgi:hypothetical protein